VAERSGVGFVVREAQLSIPGEWELRVEAREGEFDLYTDTISISIER
jgi:nitrogen fixation protein FixH